jgi:hypothetical protein
MPKVIATILGLTVAATMGISMAQAHGGSQSSLATVNAKVTPAISAKAQVGTTSGHGGGSLANLNVNVGKLANVNATVGQTSQHGGSLLDVSAIIGGGREGGVGGW